MKTKAEDEVVFEYDCDICMGPSYKYTLFSDGRFIKTKCFSPFIDDSQKMKL